MDPGGDSEEVARVIKLLRKCALATKWEVVKDLYANYPACQKAKINESLGTALHMAVDTKKEEVVKGLVNEILWCRLQQQHTAKTNPLEIQNKSGDTPLHVAASRGFTRICKILTDDGRMKYLLSRRNIRGETPLFQAVINGHKHSFLYLSHISDKSISEDLVRDNQDTILHYAITSEFFDLALLIVHYYPSLCKKKDEKRFTPLKLLASRPSAFRGATSLAYWKRILYRCILVEPVDAERQKEKILSEINNPPKSDELNYPKNYATLYEFSARLFGVVAAPISKMSCKKNGVDTENPPINEEFGFGLLPPNYETFQQSVRSAFVHVLGLSGVDINELKKTKERHQWACQLSKKLIMETLSEEYIEYMESGDLPADINIDLQMFNIREIKPEAEGKREETPSDKPDEKSLFVAARNGIVEMVDEILTGLQHPIKDCVFLYETNSELENVLLVAVMNKQPHVVEKLRKKLQKTHPEIWNTLTLGVNKNGKTMLHMAANGPKDFKPSQISGSALQLIWDVNWFQYIKNLAPEQYRLRSDYINQTAIEIFKEEHKDLRKESGEWLKETSESCSVVAALVAGVSFATAATVPGGHDDKGMPHLEDRPGFHAFAVSSLVGLCFSLTGLIMFLTIVTSRKLYREFRRDLPLKLLLGLSSLFISIVALIVSFCTSHSFLFKHKEKTIIFPIYIATCFPVTFYAIAQLPLYFDLLTTFLFEVPKANSEGDSL